jgi:hypothetical protein
MKCPVCGNAIEPGSRICPWCESQLKGILKKPEVKEKIRIVNIKTDQPTIELALGRLKSALHGAKASGVRVLKVIHGYGSSGIGGEIRFAVRGYLNDAKYDLLVSYYVSGEEFSSLYGSGRRISIEFPFLKKDSDWGRRNKGITLIVLKP